MHSWTKLPTKKAWKVVGNDDEFLEGFKKSCNCKVHEVRYAITVINRLGPSTIERIAQLITHDPNAIISRFVETALKVSMEFKEEPANEELCVVCKSDYQEGSLDSNPSSCYSSSNDNLKNTSLITSRSNSLPPTKMLSAS